MSGEVLYFGGMLNYVDPFFGLQIYLWGFIGVIILSIIAWLAWRYGQWEPYRPVWGLFYAYKAESWAAFIFNVGLVSELISEREAKCIFDYSKWDYQGLSRIQAIFFNYATEFLPELTLWQAILYKFGGKNQDVEIAKRLQNGEWESHSSVTSGGIHCDMIFDADRWSVKDSPQHKAIELFAEQWNDANPDNQIHAYPKLARMYCSENLALPEISGVKRQIVIPWSRIDASFPIEVGDNEDGGAVRQFAKEFEDQDSTGYEKYYLPLAGAGVLVILAILAARVIGLLLRH